MKKNELKQEYKKYKVYFFNSNVVSELSLLVDKIFNQTLKHDSSRTILHRLVHELNMKELSEECIILKSKFELHLYHYQFEYCSFKLNPQKKIKNFNDCIYKIVEFEDINDSCDDADLSSTLEYNDLYWIKMLKYGRNRKFNVYVFNNSLFGSQNKILLQQIQSKDIVTNISKKQTSHQLPNYHTINMDMLYMCLLDNKITQGKVNEFKHVLEDEEYDTDTIMDEIYSSCEYKELKTHNNSSDLIIITKEIIGYMVKAYSVQMFNKTHEKIQRNMEQYNVNGNVFMNKIKDNIRFCEFFNQQIYDADNYRKWLILQINKKNSFIQETIKNKDCNQFIQCIIDSFNDFVSYLFVKEDINGKEFIDKGAIVLANDLSKKYAIPADELTKLCIRIEDNIKSIQLDALPLTSFTAEHIVEILDKHITDVHLSKLIHDNKENIFPYIKYNDITGLKLNQMHSNDFAAAIVLKCNNKKMNGPSIKLYKLITELDGIVLLTKYSNIYDNYSIGTTFEAGLFTMFRSIDLRSNDLLFPKLFPHFSEEKLSFLHILARIIIKLNNYIYPSDLTINSNILKSKLKTENISSIKSFRATTQTQWIKILKSISIYSINELIALRLYLLIEEYYQIIQELHAKWVRNTFKPYIERYCEWQVDDMLIELKDNRFSKLVQGLNLQHWCKYDILFFLKWCYQNKKLNNFDNLNKNELTKFQKKYKNNFRFTNMSLFNEFPRLFKWVNECYKIIKELNINNIIWKRHVKLLKECSVNELIYVILNYLLLSMDSTLIDFNCIIRYIKQNNINGNELEKKGIKEFTDELNQTYNLQKGVVGKVFIALQQFNYDKIPVIDLISLIHGLDDRKFKSKNQIIEYIQKKHINKQQFLDLGRTAFTREVIKYFGNKKLYGPSKRIHSQIEKLINDK